MEWLLFAAIVAPVVGLFLVAILRPPRRQPIDEATWEYEAHDCPKPDAKNRGVGSVWRCTCGRPWRIVDKRWNGPYETTTWRMV